MKTRVIVKKGKDGKIRNFYPFIFKDEAQGVMGKYENGSIVDLVDHELNFIGKGYINDESHILVRVLTIEDEKIDYKFIEKKIKTAYKKRERSFKETNCARIFFSQADGLPGLIVDQFQDYLSIQFRTSGIENFKEDILKAFIKVVNPKGIYERSDVETRTKEGSEQQTGILYGEVPEKIIMEDNGLKYIVDIINGQKTGFFLDQRESRKFIRPYLNSKMKFLDVFSSSGGFSMAALKEGCKKVVAIDKDPYALELANENYKLNGFEKEFTIKEGDAFQILDEMSTQKEKYDVIVLDPPSLIKNKGEKRKGKDLFYQLCNSAYKIMEKNGILGVCTCAYHISLQDLIEVTRMSASENRKKLEVLGVSYQPDDHPWILHMPETLYLKCLWVRIED